MKTFLTFFMSAIIIGLATSVTTVMTGWSPAIVAPSIITLSLFVNLPAGVAMAGLNKELWISELLEGFYGDDSFLMEWRNFDAFVENDKLNLAEAGVNPNVLINNTTYPIPIADRNDLPISIELDRFDTENQSVKYADKAELVYDKLKSIIFGHKQALRMAFMERAVHAAAPAADSSDTPLIKCSGVDNGSGYKKMIYDDILAAQTAFDEAEVPEEGRRIIFSAVHLAQLKSEDQKLYKDMIKDGEIFGFKIHKLASKRLPKYDTVDDSKVAFGAVAPGTAQTATLFYHKDEVCRAKGTEDMFYAEAASNPQTRQDEIGFAMRGIAMPIRDKGIGAIFSPAV